jgi:3-methyladenine DNA glycosylase AlkD
MSGVLKAIQLCLHKHKTPEAYMASIKFVPNAQNVIGVRMPILNNLAKQYKHEGFTLVQDLWKSGSYEERILAAKLLAYMAKKDANRSIVLVKSFSKEIESWALCDTLGMQSLKPIVKTHSNEIFSLATDLNTSNNFWQRRLSLVLVEWYTRDKKMHPAIKALIQPLQSDTEYYVQKAVVWIEKNFAKGK